MRYAMTDNGIVTNIIVADDAFASRVGALPDYEGCAIGEPYAPPAPAPSEMEQLRADVDYIAAMTGVEL